jgi:hypothetical protein
MSILHNFFHKTEVEKTFLNSSYKVNITLIPKIGKGRKEGKERGRQGERERGKG